MSREQVLAELEQAAVARDKTPLQILGVDIDKTDARQVYGALCWIENQLLALAQRKQEG